MKYNTYIIYKKSPLFVYKSSGNCKLHGEKVRMRESGKNRQ